MGSACEHLDVVVSPDLDGGLAIAPSSWVGCTACLASGGRWVHLRLCLSCGFVGCCDSSPNRHASEHASAFAHPIVASFEPDEDWCWCYVDEVFFGIGGLWLPHRRLTPADLHGRATPADRAVSGSGNGSGPGGGAPA
jgi:hypothetical protein